MNIIINNDVIMIIINNDNCLLKGNHIIENINLKKDFFFVKCCGLSSICVKHFNYLEYYEKSVIYLMLNSTKGIKHLCKHN